MKKKFLSILLYLVTIGWMILIFVFSRQTGREYSNFSNKVVSIPRAIFYPNFNEYSSERQAEITKSLSFLVRKGAHMFEYAVLCLFMFLSVRTVTKKYEPYFIAPAFCFLYALSDEFHQGFTKGRTMSFRDVMIDFSGALLVVLFIFLLHLIKKRKKKGENHV